MAKVFPNYLMTRFMGKEPYSSKAVTVAGIIKECTGKFGDDFKNALQGTAILVNGRNINYLNGANTIISNDDEIHFFKPGAGG